MICALWRAIKHIVALGTSEWQGGDIGQHESKCIENDPAAHARQFYIIAGKQIRAEREREYIDYRGYNKG